MFEKDRMDLNGKITKIFSYKPVVKNAVHTNVSDTSISGRKRVIANISEHQPIDITLMIFFHDTTV